MQTHRENGQFEKKHGPWDDPETLEKLYVKQDLSTREIANDVFNGTISYDTVQVRLREHGLMDDGKNDQSTRNTLLAIEPPELDSAKDDAEEP